MWKLIGTSSATGCRVYATDDGYGKAYELLGHVGLALYLGDEYMGIISDLGSAP